MALNRSKGNMYDFVTHTWNTVKGECPYGCSYCYMRRWRKQPKLRFDEKELKTDLGSDNFIFVGSSCDMWADEIPEYWILRTLEHCDKFDNEYLFQTKNPKNIRRILPSHSVVCVTFETNIWFSKIMNNAPHPDDRFKEMKLIIHPLYVTIEPIMNFDLNVMIYMMQDCNPIQINIGADSGGNNLPEPPKEKILQLISELEKITIVKQKKNLMRLTGGG